MSRCVAVLALNQLITPLCATSFVPTLPLLVTHTLGGTVGLVGQLYACFSFACLLGILAVPALMRRASRYSSHRLRRIRHKDLTPLATRSRQRSRCQKEAQQRRHAPT